MDDARKAWYDARRAQVLSSVSAHDVLRHNGINLAVTSDDKEEQIPCPFHGADNKPSARVFPETDDRASHVWCFVCQGKSWDAIGLWRMFNGGYENCKFSDAIFGIEKQFNLTKIEPTFKLERPKPPEDPAVQEFKTLYVVAENLLLASKPAFKYYNDLTQYLTLGSALDQVRWATENKAIPYTRGVDLIQQIIEKIQKVRRSCPVG